MRPLLPAFALALSTSGLAADLQLSPYPNQTFAGQNVKVTLLIANPNPQPAIFNRATCPTVEIRPSGTQKILPLPKVHCAESLDNVTIPARGQRLYTLTLPVALPAGTYKAKLTFNDSVNGHKAALTTFFGVQNIPQVVQWLDLNPVYLSGEVITLKVVTRNVSGKTFSQDLRLCGTDFLIRDRLGQTVYESPKPQVCTGDLRPITLKPGQQHTEEWGRKIRLPAGTYQVFHWNNFGSAVGSFKVK
ncbi:MAG: hypothetical protein Q4C89_00635 [Deinococcus sp.]|uniref:hypothetical protein n=1 Tax=Deinococcus sp. TaxID=47478 RepID=UPI0026DD3452|nr:hypothetical protein [Deinococcus sp.]MDO4244515.1 hypothetical protein [Deinococcus sp.]